jgi:hypothetical protein
VISGKEERTTPFDCFQRQKRASPPNRSQDSCEHKRRGSTDARHCENEETKGLGQAIDKAERTSALDKSIKMRQQTTILDTELHELARKFIWPLTFNDTSTKHELRVAGTNQMT